MRKISVKILACGILTVLHSTCMSSYGMEVGLKYARSCAHAARPLLQSPLLQSVKRPYSKKSSDISEQQPYYDPLNPVALHKLVNAPSGKIPDLLRTMDFDWIVPGTIVQACERPSLIDRVNGNRLGSLSVNYNKIDNSTDAGNIKKVNILSHVQLNKCPWELGQDILNFALFENLSENYLIFTRKMSLFFFSNYEMRILVPSETVSNDVKIVHIVELDGFNKTEQDLRTLKDHFMYFLKHAPQRTSPHKGAPKPVLEAYKMMTPLDWLPKDSNDYFSTDLSIADRSNQYNNFRIELDCE